MLEVWPESLTYKYTIPREPLGLILASGFLTFCMGWRHRHTVWGVGGGGKLTPKIRADTTFIRAEDNTFV